MGGQFILLGFETRATGYKNWQLKIVNLNLEAEFEYLSGGTGSKERIKLISLISSLTFPLPNSTMPIPRPVDNYFYTLLNHPPNDPLFDRLITKDVTIKQFPECIYHSYKPQGLSFAFVDGSLEAIDVYNGITNDGFQPYTSNVPLPCGLSSEMQAHDIVFLLGEPDRKGGGARVPCWIEYKFDGSNGGGLMIQLQGVDWDDRKMGWTSIVLYK
jgi:hypothetical protein